MEEVAFRAPQPHFLVSWLDSVPLVEEPEHSPPRDPDSIKILPKSEGFSSRTSSLVLGNIQTCRLVGNEGLEVGPDRRLVEYRKQLESFKENAARLRNPRTLKKPAVVRDVLMR